MAHEYYNINKTIYDLLFKTYWKRETSSLTNWKHNYQTIYAYRQPNLES